jgi:hypothetical protein
VRLVSASACQSSDALNCFLVVLQQVNTQYHVDHELDLVND